MPLGEAQGSEFRSSHDRFPQFILHPRQNGLSNGLPLWDWHGLDSIYAEGYVLTVHNHPRRGRPPQPDRPRIIADAVVRVLADEGSKGLSHRRVDREAGLPIGSTVHHAPTRSDLFLIAAHRLNEMTLNDLAVFAEKLQDKDKISPDILAKAMMSFWRELARPDNFYRLRAEMAVLFSQEFRHEIHQIFRPQVEEFRKFWQKIFSDLDAREPAQAAQELTMWSRGIFSIMAACEGEMHEDEYEMIETWVVRMIDSFLEKPASEPVSRRSSG